MVAFPYVTPEADQTDRHSRDKFSNMILYKKSLKITHAPKWDEHYCEYPTTSEAKDAWMCAYNIDGGSR